MGVGEMACSATLSIDDITECRNNCSELSSTELDLVILGIIHSSLNCSETTISGRVEKTRQSTRMSFSYHGKRICKKTFLLLHCLQYFWFHSLVKHYKKNGLTLRTHGNAKRLPSSASSIETVERVVKFIKNVAEKQALLLPGRVPGLKRIDVKLLPSNLNKTRSLEDVFRYLYEHGASISGLFEILRPVESAMSLYFDYAACNWPMLDMPKKQ